MALWLVWNTSNDNGRQSVDHNFRHMPCERRWYRVNDPNTNLLVITKNNNFFELKSFLKHGHFVCKLAQINSAILRENSSLKILLKKTKYDNLYFVLFWLVCSIFGLKACNNASFHGCIHTNKTHTHPFMWLFILKYSHNILGNFHLKVEKIKFDSTRCYNILSCK
jgi:hypothetical protein